MIHSSVVALCVFLLGAGVSATLDPATGYASGKKPTDSWIATASATSSSEIQASECSHNTRMSNQKFAWFKIDPSKVNQNGSTYGTCYASNTAPDESQLESNSGYDVFFWQKSCVWPRKFIRNSGGQSGTGTGPIKDPNTGKAGYEDNSGKFHLGNAPGDGNAQQEGTETATSAKPDTKSGNPNTSADRSSGTGRRAAEKNRLNGTGLAKISTGTGADSNSAGDGLAAGMGSFQK
ncbi:hypothetical protein PGTUg99_031068 [Puccinia graminis f. sp. tritici]|uniref:Uncharacterized protein n=1 Tax=Puccinia graminis f. sp. tritici TaxID=56615 RepID=A0A5B0RPS5_PUCGR|nr:hypothetical protein PGTUg99_031068 [Puccinia graminis f. sp. tritici]